MEGEAIDSWLEAVAMRFNTAFGDVAEHVGIPVDYSSSWVVDLTADQTEMLAQATAIDPAAIRAGTLCLFDGLAVSVDRENRRIRNDIPWARLGPTPRSRYCPKCLAHDGGRWQLRWRLSWSFACTKHNCLLVDECPRCRRFQRRFPPPFGRIPSPGRCSISNKDTTPCGADLAETSETITLSADHRIMRAQKRINRMLTHRTADFGIYAEEPVAVQTALTDLATIAARIVAYSRRHQLHTLPKAEFIAAYDKGRARPAPLKPTRYPRRLCLEAPVTAVEAAVYATEALNIIEAATPALAAQRMAWLIPDEELPGTERILNLGLSCSRPLSSTQINAYAPGLTPPLQLRYRATSTDLQSPAASPFGGQRLASCLPGTLWPEWSIRFGLTTETYERWRPGLASAVLLVGTDLSSESAAKQLDNGTERTVHHLLRRLKKSQHWPAFCTAITRLADYLRTNGAPIDYERRRQLDYRNLLPDADWNAAALQAGALPGSTVKAEIARRYLFRKISGMPAPRNVPGARSAPQMHTRTLNFPLDLTSELQSALDEKALEFLACNGIANEPLAWHPPLDLLEGLALPIPEFEHVDIAALRTAAGAAYARVPALAKTFGVSIDTVRYLLDRHPPEPNAAGGHTARRDVLRAARNRSLTKDVLHELYDIQHLGLAAIAEQFDMSRSSVRRRAEQYGIALQSQSAHVEFDWLYQNYVVARRTQADICAELGISWPTLRKQIDRYHLPLHQPAQPRRINLSEREAHRILHQTLSRPEGLIHLGNFVRVTEYRSVYEAAEHLGINRSTLHSQIRYLTKDFGGPLLERWTSTRPIATTELGCKAVAAYDALRPNAGRDGA
ncbi:hypothetical protein A5751_23940 [Mycolicibacterium fortuitum]|nr:hypothetical protein A5751_23940 [Mycolicibacterium fortuitum]